MPRTFWIVSTNNCKNCFNLLTQFFEVIEFQVLSSFYNILSLNDRAADSSSRFYIINLHTNLQSKLLMIYFWKRLYSVYNDFVFKAKIHTLYSRLNSLASLWQVILPPDSHLGYFQIHLGSTHSFLHQRRLEVFE